LAKRAPTIYTVADHAGVSIATVSRVERGLPSVAGATASRVKASMRTVGYRPNGAARALATRHHEAIGLVFPHLSGPYYAGVILGLEEAASALGQNLFIVGTHGRARAEQLVSDLSRRVDGLVVMGRTVPDEVIARLQRTGLPLVLLARRAVGSSDVVRTENRLSAEALTRHLLEHGHRRIAFVGDPASSPDAAERWEGFVAAHWERGLTKPTRPVVSAFREVDGRAAVLDLLAGDSRPTALFCANDEIAMGAYAAADERRLSIPADLAVTGWDDIPVARFLAPALTTVRQPLEEIGALAARLVVERVAGSRKKPVSTVLPTEIQIRSSCGCQSQGGTWQR
jgi:LacI family transcriptional regulator, galactose operon repressor